MYDVTFSVLFISAHNFFSKKLVLLNILLSSSSPLRLADFDLTFIGLLADMYQVFIGLS